MPGTEPFLEPDRPISRRAFLRSALSGGAGVLATYLLACGDGDGSDGPAATGLAPTASPEDITFRWQQLAPSGPVPEPRRDHSLVTDGERVYLFGGRSGATPLADLWAYDVSSNIWEELAVPGPPAARFGHNAGWEKIAGHMIIFGGQGSGNAFFNDVWGYEAATNLWFDPFATRDLYPIPAPRYGAAGAMDLDERLVISHGFTSQGRFDDTWRYDPLTIDWEDASSPAGSDRPIERCLVRGVWDSLRNRLMMFGGQTTETPYLDDLWVLSVTGWQQIPRSPHPSARNLYAMVYDDRGKRAVLIGGKTESGPLNDVWLLDAQDEFWTEVSPAGGPSPRYGHDAVWLASGPSTYVFGGNDGTQDLNDLWRLVPPEGEAPAPTADNIPDFP